MELQEQFYSEWRSSTNKIFWGLTLAIILTFFANIFDMISWLPIAGEMIFHHSQTGSVSLLDSKVFCFGLGVKVIIVLGYVMYFIGLSDFAKTRQTENAAHYIYKVRTGSIIILITAIVNIFFGFIAIIPLIGQFFMFIMWLMYVISFFIMKSGFDGMMNCDEFSGIAKLGAKNVRYACVCVLRLLFSPIVIVIVGLIGAAVFGGSAYGMRENMSFEGLKQMFIGGAAILGIVAAIAIICLICWGICAVIWPMMGWNRIKNGGPVDTLFVVETENTNSKHEGIEQTEETTTLSQEEEASTIQVGTKTSVMQKQETQSSEQVANTSSKITIYDVDDIEPEEKPNRTLLYSIGGVIAVAIIGIICFFAFGKSMKSESILGLQKPKWEKFVHMKGKETAFFQSPDPNSPRLMQACNSEGCGIDYQYLWTGDKPNDGYKELENFKYEDATSVFPVVEEQEGWYKVQITELGDVREAYVEKSQCEEVKPEPITQEVLSSISSDYNLQEKGKNKNLCFALNTEEEIARLRIGELLDGNCLAFPFAYEATTEESDTTATSYFEVSDYTSDDGTKSYSFSIYYNPSRIVAKEDYKTFDTKSLTEEEMTDIVTKVTSIKQKFDWITYEYYFPSVSTEHLFSFRVFDEPSDEETSSATEEKSVTDYKVENKKLLALVGNEWMETGFYTEDGNIEIYHQEDLDNDGNYEIILQIFEGNAYDNPFIVYYDKASSTFKRTKSMELEENPSIETRYDPHTLMIQKEGLRTIKYVFAEDKLKIESDNMENVGRIRSTLKVADIYSGSEEGERNMTFDFDGDGEEENITFHRSMTHAEDYGERIDIVMIKWADGREIGSESNSLLRAGTFKFLVSETNGMPDVICDNYLMKWNGSNYETAE